jgi:inosose dehydratase
MNRRQFTTTLALGLAAAAVPDLEAQKPKPRKLRCGHTGITGGFRPEDAERAIADVATLGFHGYESFGNVLDAWEP